MSEELTENIRKNNNEEREDINEAPKKKPKLDSLIEDEAADSDSENEGGDDNESDIESEKDEYEKDGFVVSDDEASDSDDEGNSKRKTNNLQRLKKRTANVLDVEDQELIRDAQLQAKAEEATDDMDEEIVPERFHTDEIAPVVTKKFNQYDEYDSDDGMRDFIVDDVGEEAGEGGVEGIGGEAPRKSGDFFGQHGSVTASSRRRDGPQGASREQLEDAMAIFGDGFDEFDFDDEEEPLEEDEDLYAEPGSASEKKKIDRVKASFEHAALVESFCTSSDDVIRNTDIPERLQEWLNARKLSKKDFIGTSEDDETLSARLLSEEAKWVTRKLVEKLFYKNKKSSSAFECVDKRYNGLSKLDLTEQLNEPVLNALRYMQVDHLEVPFIATYRKDYLHPLLNSQNLWNVLTLDEKYAEFTRQKLRLTLELDVFNEVKEAWQSRNDGGVASSKLDDVERELANAEDAYNSALNEQKCSNLLLDRYMDLADTDDATDIDRENVVLEEQKIAEIAKRLGELELVLQKCRERSEIAAGRKQLSDSLDEMAVVRTLELMPVDKYRSIVDSCDEELFLSDIRNYMQMLFLGSEGAKKTTVAIEVVEEVSPPVTDGSDLRISKKPQKPITTSSLFDDDDEDDDSSDYEGEEKTSDEHTESNPDQEGKEKELAVETSVAPKKVTKHVALKKQLRRATSKDTYFKIRQLHGLREFAQLFTPSPSDFSQTLRYGAGMKTECNTPLEDVETLANEYMVKSNQSNMDCSSGLTSMFQFKSADEYVRGVQKLLAIELSHEPCVRLRMRDIYRSYATLSTEPTEKGDTVITPFHELFGYSFLKEKPICDLFELQSDATTYVRLMKAQADGLIRVTINAPDDKSCFLNPLISAYLPTMKPELDINPEIRTGWDAIRMNILKMCVEKFLIPSFEEETRRELARIGRDGIIEECTATFSEMIRQGPYRYVRDETTVIPPNQERGAPPRAMKEYPITQILLDAPERRSKFNALSLWVPQGRGAMGAAFLDEDGVVRAQSILPEDATRNALPLFIKGLLDKFRPKVVVLNSSGGRATLSLQNQLNKHLISEVSRESLEAIRRRRLAREDQGDYAFYEEYDEMPYTAQVLISEDTIARIFKESKRSTRMFKEFDPSVCAAICLGRSVQEPLAEYCMMWTNADSLGTFGFEAMYLDLHPMKMCLRAGARLELLKSLQRALVDVVCHVGVDINMALSYNHYSSMLPFIGGLGLRKADALLQNIRASKVGIVECRKILLEKKLLTRCIYMNAAGFIRICKSTAMTEYDIDPLDDTRIHPECYNTYDFATKICAEALEVDNKRDNYFETVRKTMADVHKQLEDVIFDDGRKIARGCSEGNAHVEEQLMNNWVDWKAKWRRGIRPGDTWSLVTIDDGKHADYWGEDSNKLPDYNELCDILSELELEKYAASVEASGLGKRIQQFNDIKEELRYPWLDMVRILTPVTLPSADLMFTLSTGELYENLHVGLKVTCVVKDITEKRAFVTVDDGLKGSIDISQVAETNYGDNYGRKDMHDYLSVGSQQTAVIIRVNKERCTVELSVKPSYLELGEDMWMRNRFKDDFMQDWMTSRGSGSGSGRKKPFAQFDRYFDESKALDHYAENEKKRIAEMQQSSTTSHGSSSNASRDSENAKKPVTRLVYHPLFTNCNYHEAEENLRGREVGAVVIRPSSKGGLSITWKFQENMYCHVEVEERGKRMGDIGLGKELYIKDIDEPFSDIDEIYSRYVMPKNEFVSAMIASKNFRAGSMSQVEESLKEEVKSNPQRIPYCVHIDENKPGWFVLSWIISASSKPLKSQYVLVSADGYKIGFETFSKPSELINWFKKNASAPPKPKPPVPPPQRAYGYDSHGQAPSYAQLYGGALPPAPPALPAARKSRFSSVDPNAPSSGSVAGAIPPAPTFQGMNAVPGPEKVEQLVPTTNRLNLKRR